MQNALNSFSGDNVTCDNVNVGINHTILDENVDIVSYSDCETVYDEYFVKNCINVLM